MRPSRLSALALAALGACSGAARVEVDPASVQLWEPGQTARVQAVALASNGKALPDKPCAWTTADPAVARVAGSGREATVTAAGAGSTTVRCTVGGAAGEIAVAVRLLGRVEAEPSPAPLRLLDQAEPLALRVRAFDTAGQPATPRRIVTRCRDEGVCRGDDRGQLWPVGPGATTAVVEADGKALEVPVTVEDARTAAGRPRAVTGNPMLEYEKAAKILQRERDRAAGKK